VAAKESGACCELSEHDQLYMWIQFERKKMHMSKNCCGWNQLVWYSGNNDWGGLYCVQRKDATDIY